MSRMRDEMISYLAQTVIGLGLSIIAFKFSMSYIFPELEQRKKAKSRADEILRSMGILNPPPLTYHENAMLLNIVDPSDGGTYNDIVGYSDIISTIKRRIVYPLMLSFKRNDKLLQPPKGVLLYGPPGVGKTKIARTIAGESGCRFINCDMSIVMDKYFGESQKMISALFSLAHKLQPVIIFIDEIECFLGTRSERDNETTQAIKAQFMSQWDGFIESNAKVVVMGASNLPKLIDPAILRRMPVKIEIPLPNSETRIEMFKHYLPSLELNNDSNNIMKEIALRSQGLSCADIVEISRLAVIDKVGELVDSIEILDNDFEQHVQRIEEGNHATQVYSEDLLKSVTTFVREKSGVQEKNLYDFRDALVNQILQSKKLNTSLNKNNDSADNNTPVDEIGVD